MFSHLLSKNMMITSFIKIGSGIQKLMAVGIQRHTDGMEIA
jgi:hypothetical protein